MQPKDDEYYMKLALAEARKGPPEGEVPIGCVIVHEDKVIGRAHNQRETLQDPTAHAEMIALTQAAAAIGFWRVEGTVVYCTVEPCCMCAGAMVNARVARLVYGVPQPKTGACGTLYNIPEDERLPHRFEVCSGVLAGESLELLQEFFRPRR